MDEKKIKVLLVDDEEDFLNSMSERMEIRGFDTKQATNGEQAIEMVKAEKFHVAIVDMRMPGLDGIATITKIKEFCPDIKTVLLTGYGNDKIKEASEGLGTEYFEKSKINSFWSFVKGLPKKMEDTMAAAGMATHGDLDTAREIAKGDAEYGKKPDEEDEEKKDK